MLNHARLLLAQGWSVVLAGYVNVPLPADLVAHPQLDVRAIVAPATRRWPRLPQAVYLALAAARAAAVGAALVQALLRAGPAELFLVQNPPAFPCLPIAQAVAAFRRARLVVDWHNTSTSVLAFRLGNAHPLVAVLRAFERRCARGASAHLCVTLALREALAARWKINATVVYDRPYARLARAEGARRPDVVQRSLRLLDAAPADAGSEAAVILSPSSWSLEEDMPMLIDALTEYAAIPDARALVVFATGLGPLRAAFEARATAMQNERLRIVTGWLAEDAYRELLTVADAGVCMHRSTSSLDLPMKLVDFEAAGVPVLAFDYGAALHERSLPQQTFRNAGELAHALHECLAHPPKRDGGLRSPTWDDEWRERALPVL